MTFRSVTVAPKAEISLGEERPEKLFAGCPRIPVFDGWDLR
jgi:hypothetical protein